MIYITLAAQDQKTYTLMNSSLLVSIHTISVMLFLVTYVIKTILLFSSRGMLDKYASATKVPEMIISFVFLATGIWLFVIIGGIKTFQIIKLVFVFTSIPLAIIGFKKYKKGLALLSLLLIIGAYGLAEMAKGKPFIPASASVSMDTSDPVYAHGALIYQQNCKFCHGTDGRKMYRNAPDLTMSTASEDNVKLMVTEGSKGKMPAYKIILSDENIAAVSRYVVGLRSQAGNTNATR
jgi:cytochrome c553